MLASDLIKILFAITMFLVASSVPIGCQYAVTVAPEWLVRETFYGVKSEPIMALSVGIAIVFVGIGVTAIISAVTKINEN